MSGGGGALIAMKPPLVTLPHHSTFAHRAIARHRCSRPTSHVPPVILTRLGCEQPRWWCRTRQSLLSLHGLSPGRQQARDVSGLHFSHGNVPLRCTLVFYFPFGPVGPKPSGAVEGEGGTMLI